MQLYIIIINNNTLVAYQLLAGGRGIVAVARCKLIMLSICGGVCLVGIENCFIIDGVVKSIISVDLIHVVFVVVIYIARRL